MAGIELLVKRVVPDGVRVTVERTPTADYIHVTLSAPWWRRHRRLRPAAISRAMAELAQHPIGTLVSVGWQRRGIRAG